jgi:hypothetical protein
VDISVMLTNTDAGIIEKASSIIEKITQSAPYIFEGKTKELYRADGTSYRNEQVTLMQVNVGKMTHIKAILEAVAPHLAGQKAARARLMLKFIERRMTRVTERGKVRGKQRFDGYDWGIVGEFYKLSGGKLLPEVKGLLNEHEQERQPAA